MRLILPIFSLLLVIMCVYVLIINHLFMVKRKYLKINILNWFLSIFMIVIISFIFLESGLSSGIPVPIAFFSSFLAIFMSYLKKK